MNYAATIQFKLGSQYAWWYKSLQIPDSEFYFTIPLHQVPLGKYMLNV